MEKNVSIFCNNCIGAFVAHDFRLPFNSPTVNLMIPPADYIEYITHLQDYTGAEIKEIDSDKQWPVALLGGKVHLHLIHYKTVQEAEDAWRRRERRINWERMFFVLIETDGCTYDDLMRFDALPYQHKVVLTHKFYPEIKSAFYIRGYEDKLGLIDTYRFHKVLPTRKYDQFNWMKFLKQK